MGPLEHGNEPVPATIGSSADGNRRFPLRPILYGGLSLIIWIFTVAGIATNIVTGEYSQGTGSPFFPQNFKVEYSTTLWRSCSKTNGGGSSCSSLDYASDCWMDHIRAMRAFGLLALFVALFGIAAAVMDFFGILRRLVGHRDKIVLLLIAVLIFVFSLIFWATFAGLWNSGCDGNKLKDISGAKWGASAPLYIIVWIMSMVLAAIALFVPAPPDADEPVVATKTDPAPVSHNQPV